jgi:hypothetical protein
VSKLQGATFLENSCQQVHLFRACFLNAVHTKLTNAVEELKMYHHCKKINPSNHSRYMSNGHVTSPSGMNNGISLKRGEEIWAPPERPNYAAPPSRNFSDVSCKVHILEIELYQ